MKPFSEQNRASLVEWSSRLLVSGGLSVLVNSKSADSYEGNANFEILAKDVGYEIIRKT